jgi:hypothetical protein
MKKGQITVFIIIGLIILLIIGTVLYLTQKEITRPFEAARPRVAELPQEVQPLRDLVESCIRRLATDGLRKIGDSGGYLDTTQLSYNIFQPTEGQAVQFSPGAGPNIAYWWHMSSKNKCGPGQCEFTLEKPGLYRSDGGTNIEAQLDSYVTRGLPDCLGNFQEFEQRGCEVQEQGEPKVTSNIAKEDVFFVGKYSLRAVCEEQSYEMEDYYVSIELNFKEIFELATELANFQMQQRFLEQVTKNLIATYGNMDSSMIPPTRKYEVGPPKPGTFWIKNDIKKRLQSLLTSYIPVIQVANVRNYNYIRAPPNVRDREHYELLYNRQFLIPINVSHHSLEARFSYLDWWEPYFDLNCNGQLCEADSASSFMFLPFTINRYEFAYDISYPVLVEIRNPSSFNDEGYSFKFFIEQNLRNSDALLLDTIPVNIMKTGKPPSLFCDPAQMTSGTVSVYVKDGKTLQGLNGVGISYLCGEENCNIGLTTKGNLTSKFPRCIGGALRVTKQGYASQTLRMDTSRENPLRVEIMLEPVRILNASIKNYAFTKFDQWDPWVFAEGGGPLRPPDGQSSTIMLIRNGGQYDEPFTAVTEIKGDGKSEIQLIPGNYSIKIMSFYRGNITFPPDERCIRIKIGHIKKKKCYFVPKDALIFNETSPYPYGGAEINYQFTSTMLRAADEIEFRQYVQGIDKIAQNNRIIEDLQQIETVMMYSASNPERIYPVLK